MKGFPLHTKKLAFAAILASSALTIAACGSSNNSGSTDNTTKTPGGGSHTSTGGGGGSVPQLSVQDFKTDFSAMTELTSLASQGQGKIAVLLPDTTSSARYTEFDAPYLKEAFEKAGMSDSDFSIVNAQGSTQTQQAQAQAAITNGAKVLIVDPLDSGTGAAIESAAKAANVDVIDYDRLTLGGSRGYYISFDNVQVGKLIGQGFVDCATAWGVTKPNVIEMVGDPTDNNATLFAQGYNDILNPLYANGSYVKEAAPAGTWDPPTAQTEFEQAFTAHPSTNGAIVPNDENAAPIITYLKTRGIKAKTFPITGQDATLVGLQNILSGYQCGTVYKPIALEAQGAAALAIYLNAGQTPPTTLVNGTTEDTTAKVAVPSVLLVPEWVTTVNMAGTVVKDGAVPASQLCTGAYKQLCTAAGIS